MTTTNNAFAPAAIEMSTIDTTNQDVLDEMEQYRDGGFHYEDGLEDVHSLSSDGDFSPLETLKLEDGRRPNWSRILCFFTLLVVSATLLGVSIKSSMASSSARTTKSESESKSDSSTIPELRKMGCVFGDRFENEHIDRHNKLFPGQFICSHNKTNQNEENNRYQFGLTLMGDLVLQDTFYDINNYDKVIYKNPNVTAAMVKKDFHFSLTTGGAFVVHGGRVPWRLSPNKNQQMQLTEECLDSDGCPYLHLHNDGVLVVNYLKNGDWVQKNAFHVYNF